MFSNSLENITNTVGALIKMIGLRQPFRIRKRIRKMFLCLLLLGIKHNRMMVSESQMRKLSHAVTTFLCFQASN